MEKKLRIGAKSVKFIFVSGIGWMMDFSIFTCLVKLLSLEIFIANCISSFIAITFVFIISTRRIFENNTQKLNLKYKYIAYIVYQVVLIVLISLLAAVINSYLFSIFHNFINLQNNAALITKMLITPVTMILNFMVMKYLIEKI